MRTQRGSTLVEVLVSSTVLILGMTGVVQLFIAGMHQFGRATGRAIGQDLSSAAIAQDLATPFGLYTPGTYDAGILIIDGRRFARTRFVTDITDGGVQSQQIVIQTAWQENLGALLVPRTAQATTVISEVPDAG